MELEIKKKSLISKWIGLAGILSFVWGLFSLAILNAALLLKTESFPDFFLVKNPMFGIIFGVIGLFTRRRPRLYAWWGLGINVFILLFTFLMFMLAWMINAKP